MRLPKAEKNTPDAETILNQVQHEVQHDRMVCVSFFCHPEPGPELVLGSSISGSLFLV
jgi:hypothetical protein